MGILNNYKSTTILLWLVLILMVGVSMVSADLPPAPPVPADDDQYEELIRCHTVWSQLSLCDDYVYGGGGVPSATCCSAARIIYESPDHRQLKCSCLQSFWIRGFVVPPFLTNYLALPGKCGIKLPIQITPDTDCSRIQ